MRIIQRFKKSMGGFWDSFYTLPQPPETILHRGSIKNDTIRFKHILVVDDIKNYVQKTLNILTSHYTSGEVSISMAYTYSDAMDLLQNRQYELAILDYDLQDEEGCGGDLAEEIQRCSPTTVVLANSKLNRFNKILLNKGAVFALEKRGDFLLRWLGEQDPV